MIDKATFSYLVAVLLLVIYGCDTADGNRIRTDSIRVSDGLISTRLEKDRKQTVYTSTLAPSILPSELELASQYWIARHCLEDELGSVDSIMLYSYTLRDTILFGNYDRYGIVSTCDSRSKFESEYLAFVQNLIVGTTHAELQVIDSVLFSLLDRRARGDKGYKPGAYRKGAMALAYSVATASDSYIPDSARSILFEDLYVALSAVPAIDLIHRSLEDLRTESIGVAVD